MIKNELLNNFNEVINSLDIAKFKKLIIYSKNNNLNIYHDIIKIIYKSKQIDNFDKIYLKKIIKEIL